MNVKCKVNFILDGTFIRAGSIIDLSEIPKALRKKQYLQAIEKAPVPLSQENQEHEEQES